MTGDTAILGAVLAMIGVPRAVFMLIGGALVDHYSPKTVLMLTKHINTALLTVLAALVLSHTLQLWMVYVIALGLGLSTAFSIPSGSSILPRVVDPRQLQGANGMLMGIRQLSMFAGPLLAGLLIAVFGKTGEGTITDARGLGAAFLFDAFSFALSAWTLSKVQLRTVPGQASRELPGKSDLLGAVAEGLRNCWNDVSLRTCFAYWAAIAFFISGPLQVAMPVLANSMPSGAAALGTLSGAFGAGTLLGMAFSGARPNLRLGSLGGTILMFDAIAGALFIPLGYIHAVWQGCLILVAIGLLGGFIQVAIFTWMQSRVAPSMLGRTMSLFMFIFMGIAPLSASITGWLMHSLHYQQLFVGSGAMLILIVVSALCLSPMRQINDVKNGVKA
jgi:MFS family permease